MNRQDATTRRTTTAIVAAVALFAAGDSYSHIYDLARLHHESWVSAALLPLAATDNGASLFRVRLPPSIPRHGHTCLTPAGQAIRFTAILMKFAPGQRIRPFMIRAGAAF